MLLTDKKIAIIGGGPGGLTLARLLQLKGVDVKVYERDFNKDVRVQGATLDLHYESGLKAIEKAGLLDAFKAAYRPGAEIGRVLDEAANIIYDEHSEVYDKEFGDETFRPEIDRGDLRDILLESLDSGTVLWDSHLATIAPVGDVWELEFKNGTKIVADIVIGADGANSKIRPMVTSAATFYARTTIIQGNVEKSHRQAPVLFELLKGGKIYVHSDGKFLHVSAKGDGSIDFYISCIMEENWLAKNEIDFSDRPQWLTWCEEEFKGWDRVWFELFENVSMPLLIRPQYCVPLDQSWNAQSNITLLGDAAHIMPPSGEGVNLAMLDALELCDCLTSADHLDTQTAIAVYEKQMQERALAEARESLDGVEWMHAKDATDKLVDMFNQNQ